MRHSPILSRLGRESYHHSFRRSWIPRATIQQFEPRCVCACLFEREISDPRGIAEISFCSATRESLRRVILRRSHTVVCIGFLRGGWRQVASMSCLQHRRALYNLQYRPEQAEHNQCAYGGDRVASQSFYRPLPVCHPDLTSRFASNRRLGASPYPEWRVPLF